MPVGYVASEAVITERLAVCSPPAASDGPVGRPGEGPVSELSNSQLEPGKEVVTPNPDALQCRRQACT